MCLASFIQNNKSWSYFEFIIFLFNVLKNSDSPLKDNLECWNCNNLYSAWISAKLNLVKLGFMLKPIFATVSAASKMMLCSKSVQKWEENNHLNLLVLIRDTLCIHSA